MTRNKRPQTDQGEFVTYENPDALVVPAYREDIAISEAERKKSVWFLNNLRHRVRNGNRDPMCVLLVLDLVQRWSPRHYIRTRYMVNELNRRRRSFMWDPITVGKIMGELCEIGAEAYAERPDLHPVMGQLDGRGNIYFVNSVPTTYRYFWKLRRQLQQRCSEVMSSEAEGSEPRFLSAWDGLDTSAEW